VRYRDGGRRARAIIWRRCLLGVVWHAPPSGGINGNASCLRCGTLFPPCGPSAGQDVVKTQAAYVCNVVHLYICVETTGIFSVRVNCPSLKKKRRRVLAVPEKEKRFSFNAQTQM
jgi:hypothetical protein